MLRLRTLGGVLVEGPAGPLRGPASQRRRLALLVLLASSERGITRDQLVAYLWPDSSEERARHALAQLLYGVRRELGEEVVVGDALTLRLNAAVISSDILDFRSAVANNDLEKAAELYAGSFMDGFFLSGCDEFERWVDMTRNELAHRAREVLQTLATRAAERGALTTAAEAWRRLAHMFPLDSRVALSLMKALSAAGDRAGALEFARKHETIMREELDAAPDPSIVEFAKTLKATQSETPRRIVDGGSDTTSADPVPVASAVQSSSRGAAELAAPDRLPRSGTRPERWRWAAPFVLGLGTLAAIGAVASLRSQTDVPKKWVLIAEAENATGDDVFDRTLPVALAAALAQSNQVYPVPPDRVRQSLLRMRRPGADSVLDVALAREIAQREGVAAVAVPSAERSGSGFELSVRLIDPGTGGVLSLSAVRANSRAEVIGALDKLGRDVRRRLGESRFSVARNPTYLPLVTTVSLDALKKFADGGRAFQSAKYSEAAALWKEAVALDSGFASAHASLGMVSYWTNHPTEGAAHYKQALALAGNLPEREKLRIRASAEAWRGNRDSAIAMLRPYVTSHPEDLDLWNMLGYNYLRSNKNAEAEEVLLRVTALDTMDFVALINLATVQKAQRRYQQAIVSYRRAFVLDPGREVSNDNVNLEYGATYVLNHQPDSARAIFMRLLASSDPLRQARALRSLAFLDMYFGRFQPAAEGLAKAADMMRVAREGVSEIRNRLLLAQAQQQIDPERNVRPQLELAYDVTTRIDAPIPILLWVGKGLARAGDVQRADQTLETMGKKVQPDVRAEVAAREVLQGEVLLARGRAQEALPHLRDGYASDGESHALESLAYGLAAAGALDSAAARYAQLESMIVFGSEPQIFTQLAGYWLGRVDEARNDSQRAREAYQRFVERWKDGDPSLGLIVDARARIARLNASGR